MSWAPYATAILLFGIGMAAAVKLAQMECYGLAFMALLMSGGFSVKADRAK